MTGKNEWVVKSEDYDYQQEVARAAFADMLHDSERNRLYYDGLRAAIALKRAKGEPVHVLDIGTGTGLLSMMAAKIGADSITAVEEFRPMANCAEQVIADNGFADRIKLVRKRSTNVKVGPGLDMETRANILVTEVFDTELIGEGAIGTFNHAHKELLTADCYVVPSLGIMYAQVVSSDLASRWNNLKKVSLGKGRCLVPPSNASSSSVSLALHDIQLSQLNEDEFIPLTGPLAVFKFDFSGQTGSLPINEQSVETVKALNSGTCDAIFMWWELKMDPEQRITLSCAPKWAHPNPESLPWRDHWMQAVYYPLSSVSVEKDQDINVISNHDEYSLWFDVSTAAKSHIGKVPMPEPSPGIHLAVSRTRLGQINDVSRNAKLVKTMENAISKFDRPPVCLNLSEQSLMPVIAAKLGAGKVVVYEKLGQMRQVLRDFAEANHVSDRIEIVNRCISEVTKDDIDEKVDLILGEPNFSLSLLPWHNLLFWYSLTQIRNKVQDAAQVPIAAELWTVPVRFRDLWKIRSPLHHVEGFKMKKFDELIMGAISVSDSNVEPHPLWEYPCTASGLPTKLMEFDLTKSVPMEDVHATKTINVSGHHVNGMALWMIWKLDSETFLSTGPVKEIDPNTFSPIEWDMHSKQGVFFFPNGNKCQKGISSVKCLVTFKPEEGDFDFNFRLL